MLDEAREVLGKGKDALRDRVQDVVEVAQERGKKLFDEARKQSVGLLALAARHGVNLLEDWADLAPRNIARRRHRRSGNAAKLLVGLAAVAAVGYFLVAANKAAAPTEEPAL